MTILPYFWLISYRNPYLECRWTRCVSQCTAFWSNFTNSAPVAFLPKWPKIHQNKYKMPVIWPKSASIGIYGDNSLALEWCWSLNTRAHPRMSDHSICRSRRFRTATSMLSYVEQSLKGPSNEHSGAPSEQCVPHPEGVQHIASIILQYTSVLPLYTSGLHALWSLDADQ